MTIHSPVLTPPIHLNQYIQRRQTLMQTMLSLTQGGVAIICTNAEQLRNGDAHFPYRYDSNFYYLTGFNEPDAVLFINANHQSTVLFCRDKDFEKEIWDGYRWGPKAAAQAFGFDCAYSINELAQKLPELLANQVTLYMQIDHWIAQSYIKAIYTDHKQNDKKISLPEHIKNIHPLLAEQRLIKDNNELKTMAQSAKIAAQAHIRTMQSCRVGQYEYELEANLLHEFRQQGAQSPAYNSIVATGANACVLHYRAGNSILRAGDMVLIDAGCELDGYASDITRTFPANGVFTAEQTAIYELVLAAQIACLEYLTPNKLFNEYNDAAIRVLSQGLLDLGWLKGSLDSVIEQGTYRQFYMHKAGHWLGMDVHDCGDYRLPLQTIIDPSERQWRPLQAGMVLTVEPGLYIRPANNVPEAFWNIGIRIEDDAVITQTGHTLISRDVPVRITDIEAIMRQ